MTAKTVLLTGATGAIGSELLRNLLKRGDTVLAVTRSAAKLEPIATATTSLPGKLIALENDLLTADTTALAADLAARELLPHHLINNARDLANLRTENGNIKRSQWLAEFDLGVAIPAALTLALANAPNARLQAVVNVSSMYGMVAVNPNLYDKPVSRAPGHYGVVKAALLHLTKELAVQLAPRGIRVNAVSYGGIEGRSDEAFRARYGALAPAGRMLRLDEVFAPIEFLLADASAVTGHNLVADGGLDAVVKRIAIIPARGGSKRIPRKNIIDFCGKPMLAWTIQAAIESEAFHHIVVSTEDEEIADVARAHGAEVPFLRQSHHDDIATASEATLAALVQADAHFGTAFETVVQLMPNCPLRSADDIAAALNAFESERRTFQLSCARFGWMNPWWALKLDAEGRSAPLFPDALKSRSQELPPLFTPTGAIWIAHADALRQSRSFYGPDHRFHPLSWISGIDIDDENDLALAKAVWHIRPSAQQGA